MQTTVPMKTATLNVPGASIYYEVRGAGPALLMMPGGPADAGAFRNIAGPLAAHYTVVTYDPRGLSHTRIRQAPPPPPPGEPTPEMREGMAQMQRNMDFWFRHYFQAIAHYEPDFDALKSGSTRIVPGVGDASRGELAHEGGLALARRLGTEAVVFPGAHGGFDTNAAEFAVKLQQVFGDRKKPR